jgi:hypothetical protein
MNDIDMNSIDMNGISLGDHGERLAPTICPDDAMSAASAVFRNRKVPAKSSIDFALRLFEFLEVKLPDHSKRNITNPSKVLCMTRR